MSTANAPIGVPGSAVRVEVRRVLSDLDAAWGRQDGAAITAIISALQEVRDGVLARVPVLPKSDPMESRREIDLLTALSGHIQLLGRYWRGEALDAARLERITHRIEHVLVRLEEMSRA